MSDTNYPRSLVDQEFGLCISPEDLIFPFYYQSGGNYFRPWKWFNQSGIKDSGSVINDNEDVFKITLDVQHFLPNEINVKVSDSEVIIHGNHSEKQDSHGFISRQFTRRYILPFNCISDTVECTLSSDGVLIITAKKSFKVKQDKEITVPIQLYSAQTKTEHQDVKSSTMMVEESTLAERTDISQREIEKIRGMQIISKEEHCRLLKPEFLGPAIFKGNEIRNTGATLKLSEENVESVEDQMTLSSNISVGTRTEQEEKASRNQLLQQNKTIENIEAQEINTRSENITMEKKISQRASEVIEGMKSSQDIFGSEAVGQISQKEQFINSKNIDKAMMEEQISQRASEIIGEIISESSSSITDEKLSQIETLRAEEAKEKIFGSEIVQQSKYIENKEVYNEAKNVMVEEQFSQNSSSTVEEVISASNISNIREESIMLDSLSLDSKDISSVHKRNLDNMMTTVEEVTSASNIPSIRGESIMQDSLSLDSKEISSVHNKNLENMMTSETQSKIKEYKDISESMQASISSASAVQESIEQISVNATQVIDKGTKIEELIENSSTSCGLSGMNATIEEIIEKCNAEMADIANKIAESHMVASSEKTNMSMSFQSSEMQESSLTAESFSSSNIKGTAQNKSSLMHDVIAELKDAAENM